MDLRGGARTMRPHGLPNPPTPEFTLLDRTTIMPELRCPLCKTPSPELRYRTNHVAFQLGRCRGEFHCSSDTCSYHSDEFGFDIIADIKEHRREWRPSRKEQARSEATTRERLVRLNAHLLRCVSGSIRDPGVSGAYACAASCVENVLNGKDPFDEP